MPCLLTDHLWSQSRISRGAEPKGSIQTCSTFWIIFKSLCLLDQSGWWSETELISHFWLDFVNLWGKPLSSVYFVHIGQRKQAALTVSGFGAQPKKCRSTSPKLGKSALILADTGSCRQTQVIVCCLWRSGAVCQQGKEDICIDYGNLPVERLQVRCCVIPISFVWGQFILYSGEINAIKKKENVSYSLFSSPGSKQRREMREVAAEKAGHCHCN